MSNMEEREIGQKMAKTGKSRQNPQEADLIQSGYHQI